MTGALFRNKLIPFDIKDTKKLSGKILHTVNRNCPILIGA